jgi:hypothetical protein
MTPLTPILYTSLSLALFFLQEPAPPASPPTPSASGQQAPQSPPLDSKGRPIPSFLILGTVFDDKALALPGARVRVRRRDEKKFRAETYTNSRGEFAVRVVPGYEYEVSIHLNKYQDQTKTVDSTVDVQQRLSIKLEPVGQSKAGAKP